ncbi:Protein-tyrosine-phosphatase [gamma proteobacterium HdN1]|nr:Protein-tyrosine-phosphatase [gamma proteobacterium HdN1]
MIVKTKVLFVCLGNICRSPTAEAVLRKMLQDRGLTHLVDVDSAGTGNWHAGSPPDERAVAAAQARGYDMAGLKARQIEENDYRHFDLILAMDRSNVSHMRRSCTNGTAGKIGLVLEYAQHSPLSEVPDPYYGEGDGFELVLDLLEDACDCLIERICAAPNVKRIGS